MHARPRKHLRPRIGVTQVDAVEHQPVPRDRAGDRNAHPLSIHRNIGVERENTARHRIGNARTARCHGCEGLRALPSAGQKPVAARRLDIVCKCHALGLDPRWSWRRFARAATMQRQHHIAPDWCRAARARDGLHRIPLEIADPDSNSVAIREPHAPIVAHRF